MYSILSVCPHSDPRIEVSLHMFSCGCRRWVSGVSVVVAVSVTGLLKCHDACREAPTRHLVAADSIVGRKFYGFVKKYKGRYCHCDSGQRITIRHCATLLDLDSKRLDLHLFSLSDCPKSWALVDYFYDTMPLRKVTSHP